MRYRSERQVYIHQGTMAIQDVDTVDGTGELGYVGFNLTLIRLIALAYFSERT
jgi:hypothetical protein